MAELADLEALDQQLSQNNPGSTLDDVDVEMLEQRLGRDAVADLTALRELERELERQGYLQRSDDGLKLTPRALRRLGQTALKRVFAQIEAVGSRATTTTARTGRRTSAPGSPGRGSSATSCRSTRPGRSPTRSRRAGLPGPGGRGLRSPSRTSR